ncbi:ABC transporter substrate-binding protein [Gordonibacter massiliensis (ex Traore et al. 2017)]|uniref:ABC transporter substrate-binding protein n=1 Tax=Gordonibacter massiliensis (ex Traore et al. 2017) TaxID=1841863 RepID=A0A842JAS2_9ACTN|nr:ABC transporter substrate-binding protein [Gordonibacter massiliensis (ex Traore et al. 2017)]MBC2888827.1 ABC transporter substrate-binding protein [Gordonibacter massiliensis (ex Traore et al. 2017)]
MYENEKLENGEEGATAPGATRAVTRRRFLVLLGAAAGTVMAGAALPGCTGGSEADGGSDAPGEADSSAKTVTVTDFDGKEVVIPADAQHIGALLGNSYPQVLFLGGASRTTYRFMTDTTWIDAICPDVEAYGIEYYKNAREPNIEDLMQKGVDLVFYWGGLDDQVKKMNDAGIPVVVSNPSVTDFKNQDDWRDLIEREIMLYADALGDEAVAKARDWLAYVDEKVAAVSAKTKSLSGSDVKRVYYIRKQDDGLQCFAASSYPKILVQIAGGTLVSGDVDTQGSGFTEVNMEQVIDWDPEYVFTGWLDSVDGILANEQWAPVTAIKNGEVHLTPCSLNTTFWDYGTEAPLDMLYIAKTIHPELFSEIDMEREIKEFYQRFYNVKLTDEQARFMLERKGPDGGPLTA